MIYVVSRKTIWRLCFVCMLGSAFGLVSAVLSARSANAQPEGSFLSRFDNGDPLPDGWQISNFAVRSPGLRTAWTRNAVTSGGLKGMPLELRLYPAPAESDKNFFGGQVQRQRRTHYGHYEVEMTAGRGNGVISSFFTYTGPYFGDPHDEIDFEFLGRDTTKVWVNRFAKGERLPGKWIDLGLDAAAGPNVYAFDWLPDRIIWFVNGREIHRIEAKDRVLPDIPGRIYFDIWTGGRGQTHWAGWADQSTESLAKYYCISYRLPHEQAPSCSDERASTVQSDE